jgi:hypothetical protein
MREVDRDGTLDPDERQRRFDVAWRAYFADLGAKGRESLRRRRAGMAGSPADLAFRLAEQLSEATPLTADERRKIAGVFLRGSV